MYMCMCVETFHRCVMGLHSYLIWLVRLTKGHSETFRAEKYNLQKKDKNSLRRKYHIQ